MFCVGATAFPSICDYLVYQHICVLSHTSDNSSGSDSFDTETHRRRRYDPSSGQNSFNTDSDIDTFIVSLSQRLLKPVMDSTEVRAPQLWRRPHAKIYGYNQDFSANYYSPMLEYVQSKNRQGIFFTKPVEKIHLPDGGELGMRKPEERIETAASPFDLDTFLVRSFSQQIKEVNKDTVHTQNRIMRGSRDNTVLHPKLTATMLRDHYVRELHQLKARGPLYS